MPRSHNRAREQANRNARAREEGWSGYAQKRYWSGRLDTSTEAGRDRVRDLAASFGGEVEESRKGSLMSTTANNIVNARPPPAREWDWRVRLLAAAGKIGPKRQARRTAA